MEANSVDKGKKALLVCGKVQCMITCSECHKPSCVYSQSKLTTGQVTQAAGIKNSSLYTCGAPLFPPGMCYKENLVVREALVCSWYVKTQYYSSVLVQFPPVCYYCGQCEETLTANSEMKELKSSYALVYPIHFLCFSKGKRPQPSNMAKRCKTCQS